MVRLYDTAYQMTDLLHGQMAERPDSSSVSKLRVSVCVCVCVCERERERERERLLKNKAPLLWKACQHNTEN